MKIAERWWFAYLNVDTGPGANVLIRPPGTVFFWRGCAGFAKIISRKD